jgi:hypothetical protein
MFDINEIKKSLGLTAVENPSFSDVEYDFATDTWVSRTATAAELDAIKAEKIAWIKAKAGEEITSIAPIYKQINLIREGKATGTTADPAFGKIDTIRTKSNDMEAKVNAATTIGGINVIVW